MATQPLCLCGEANSEHLIGVLGSLDKILTVEQRIDKRIERLFGLLIRPGEADQLIIKVHGEVLRLGVVDNRSFVHRRQPFLSLGMRHFLLIQVEQMMRDP